MYSSNERETKQCQTERKRYVDVGGGYGGGQEGTQTKGDITGEVDIQIMREGGRDLYRVRKEMQVDGEACIG